jgi:hypothetical protein
MSRKIVDISDERIQREDEILGEYTAHKMRFDETGDIDAAIKAGKAWRRWLDLFMTEAQREWLGAHSENVVALPIRGGSHAQTR